MGLNDDPYCTARCQVKGVTGAQCQMNMEEHAAIHQGVEREVAWGKTHDLPGQNISSTQGFWFVAGQQNVSGPYSNSHFCARFNARQGDFQANITVAKPE